MRMSRSVKKLLRECHGELFGAMRLYSLPPQVRDTIRGVRRRGLTYLSRARLVKLANIALWNENNGVAGIIVEAGCARGGSSIVMAAAKAPQREMWIHDVFGMIPRPSEKDGADVHDRYEIIEAGCARGIKGKPYYGYVQDLQKEVVNGFRECGYPIEENNIRLFKGLLQDTLEINQPVSLAHIDVDWYEPVYFALQKIEPWLSDGGAIIVDDYHYWSGCRSAVDNFFSSKRKSFEFDDSAGSLVVVRL